MPTVAQVVSISDSSEPNPWLIRNGYLYFGQNFGGNPNHQGYVKKLDLSSSQIINVYGPHDLWAMWKAVYVFDKNWLVFVGEANDSSGTQRAGVTIVDLANDTGTTILHPNTGDANELIGVVYDYRNSRLIVGERAYGGVTTGSSWPNGGGLWIMPIDSIDDTSTWERVYEDPDNAAWTSITVFKGEVYASLFRSGVKAVIVKASLDDLTTWSTVEQSSNNSVYAIHDSSHGLLAYPVVDSNGNIVVKWTTDGSTFGSATVGTLPSDAVALVVRVVGKYVVLFVQRSSNTSTDVYMVDTGNGSVLQIGSVSGYVGHGRGVFDGEQNLYFGASGGPPSYIYKLAFDNRYVLSLSISNQNPSPGETITLTATLTDGTNPVSGAEIEFYVITAGGEDEFSDGTLIGTATTDSNGQASVQYTVPSNASGSIVFRAVFKG